MKIFVVKVTAYIPYPITREYTEKASNFSAAIGRAVHKYRKEDRVGRKHISNMTVSAGVASLK